ncbi:MAG: DUF4919 domain-containing protein [Chlorobi bacterium]|nr:DUF4919 domain-containing protein [Chlorobiota bacterium]
MLKSVLLFLLITAFNISLQAQKYKAPDCKRINKKITKKDSKYYYPFLMKRYLSSDTTLVLKEKRLLYYGFVFSDEFRTDRNKSYRDSLRVFFRMNELTDLDAENIIRFSDSILVVNPFNLKALNYRAYAFEHTGNKAGTQRVIYRINLVLEAILSSGHGLSTDSPFYVIRESDEYALIDVLGFLFEGYREKVNGKYDKLSVKGKNKDIDALYFYINTCE